MFVLQLVVLMDAHVEEEGTKGENINAEGRS